MIIGAGPGIVTAESPEYYISQSHDPIGRGPPGPGPGGGTPVLVTYSQGSDRGKLETPGAAA
eukprot:182994-Hanusia_phi.AAC.1